jgi:hypothetical protein|tara:strand:+ start:576 stop:776 length:201 start_codon:yes stop_codon:yes gene_type:complete
MVESILIAKNLQSKGLENSTFLLSRMANRHGLIASVSGAGKTVTLLMASRRTFLSGCAGVYGGCEG